MLKNILELNGAQELNKGEQKEVSGGIGPISTGGGFCGGDIMEIPLHWCDTYSPYHLLLNGKCYTCA